jgi:hypothetical protein
MKNNLLSVSILILSLAFFASCGSSYRVTKVGQLNMASTKNIDNSKDYQELKTYAGISGQDIEAAMRKSNVGMIKTKSTLAIQINELKGESLDEGIDKVVRNVPGGTYMTNIVIYKVTQGDKKAKTSSNKAGSSVETVITEYYIVSGDVWGVKKEDVNIRGFRKGDKVVIIETSELKKVRIKVKRGKQVKGEIVELQGVKAMVKLGEEFDYKIVGIPYSSIIKSN